MSISIDIAIKITILLNTHIRIYIGQEDTDEAISRLDAKLKYLIQEGQDALKSTANVSADDIGVNDRYSALSPPPMNRYRSI